MTTSSDARPERRAVERIKRKATGLAMAAIADYSAERAFDSPEDVLSDPVRPPLARKCRCADAEIKAYREGADWICHTCGYELPPQASSHHHDSVDSRPRALFS